MKPWHQVVVPHRDIREGHLDEAVFAASLGDVVNGRGPLDYRDAATFFRKTYPTQGLLKLLGAVVGRLAGTGRGQPVIQIQTPFGGGKTHALVALYHLFRDPARLAVVDGVAQVLRESGASAMPRARLVTFDGTAPDTLAAKTPWGELAAQLRRYADLSEHDERRRTPGKDLLCRLLADQPTLILMDEIAEYTVKAADFREQVLLFFQELTEAVKVLPHCALVVTMPASVPYGEVGERALDQLQRIFGRVEAIYTPVEGAEIYEVIRRRLFEDLGDPQEARRVAEAYWQLYQRLGHDVPAEAREPAYRERLAQAYPFHPQLIDTLYERWSTFPTFQRTRGVLRLLAHVVADLYQREHPAPLIQAAHLNLAQPPIRRELLKHIGNAYEGVIAADIVNSNAKAQRIDRELGSEYARFGVASGLATAIFFGSFSGGERRGVNAPTLRLAFLREGIPPAIVGDALSRLEEELWYLHVERGLYQFRSTPNLNRVILEYEEAVNEADIAAQVRSRLERLAGNELKVTLYPTAPGDIPDNRELKLALLSGDYPGQSPATVELVRNLLSKTSSAFRTYRNTLFILAPEAGALASLRQQVKRYLALKAIEGEASLLRSLSDEDKERLRGKLREVEGGLDFQLLAAYRHLARAGAEGDVSWTYLSLPTVGERTSLARRVREFLKSQDMLLDQLAPRYLVEKALGKEEGEKPLGELYEAFLRYPHLPLLEGKEVLRRAVAKGVRERLFGVKVNERVYLDETVNHVELQDDAVLLRREVAERLRQPEPPVSPPPPTGGCGGTGSNTGRQEPTGGVTPPGGPAPRGIRSLRLRVQVPWDRLSDVVRGVVMPLHADGARLEIEIVIQAQAESGEIKQSTLEQKVHETLRQIGASVLEETKG